MRVAHFFRRIGPVAGSMGQTTVEQVVKSMVVHCEQ